MEHLRKPYFCDFNGKRLDFAGPCRGEALPDACQRKSADPVKQASEEQRYGYNISFMPGEGASSGMNALSIESYNFM
jgi:hypothetical protein